MTEPRRKLAAIMAADIVGYSRLMGADEAGTLAALRDFRANTFAPAVDASHGQIIKSMGDGWLVEFDSVVNAVAGAVRIQSALIDHATIKLRVGVHLGDVVHEEEDIFGDGVNIAARLQEICEPGALTISEDVNRQLAGKTETLFVDGGEPRLKNIERAMRIFVWRHDVDEAALATGAAPRPDPFSGRPSIAVLPFENLSSDPEQEYFADGVAEDIITALSKIRWFVVIARNSSFAYKGRTVDIAQVRRDLNVRYVVEGSVRQAGKRVRITAQLVDAHSGSSVWAERFDREMDDIFDLQDEMTETLVAAIEPELSQVERERARRKPADNLDAWDCYQRGMWQLHQYNKEANAEARRLFARAAELDPEFSSAHAGLSIAWYFGIIGGHVEWNEENHDAALAAAQRAIALDQRDFAGHFALGRVLTNLDQFERAIAALEACLEINPSFAQAYHALGFVQQFWGKGEAAIASFDKAMRLSPRDTYFGGFLFGRCLSHLVLRQHEEALVWATKATERPKPSFWAFFGRAVALAQLDRTEEAKTALAVAVEINPELDYEFFATRLKYRNPADLALFTDGIMRAGFSGP